MSTSYDIVCTDCDETTGFNDCRHKDVLLAALRHRHALESAARVLDFAGSFWWFFDIADEGRLAGLFVFLAKHVEHPLAVRDEYGTFHAK